MLPASSLTDFTSGCESLHACLKRCRQQQSSSTIVFGGLHPEMTSLMIWEGDFISKLDGVVQPPVAAAPPDALPSMALMPPPRRARKANRPQVNPITGAHRIVPCSQLIACDTPGKADPSLAATSTSVRGVMRQT